MTGTALLSVVVCTHERPENLTRCLDSLTHSTEPLEVIVVDSASRSRMEPLVDLYRGRFARLAYVYLNTPGLSRARNEGIRAATADVIAFVDDDATVEPRWAQLVSASFADPEIGCVGGACLPAFECPRPPWLSDGLLQFAGATSFGGTARVADRRGEQPFGANMSFRRVALEQVGGFDENLGRVGRSLVSGEDGAAVTAIRDAGWIVWLEPSAVVHHAVSSERCTSRYYWRRVFWEGVTHARMGRSWRRPVGLAIEVPTYLLRWALSGDRLYLYRATAEPAGHLFEWTQLRRTRG